MKKLLILGAGTAGTMMANHLNRKLNKKEWKITIVDQHKTHYYQPGFLFIPFDTYSEKDVIKTKKQFIPNSVDYIEKAIEIIEHDKNNVVLKDGTNLSYDILIIATGSKIVPGEVDGLDGEGWHKNVFDFYTIEGAVALRDKLKTWEGGKFVVHLTDLCEKPGINVVDLTKEPNGPQLIEEISKHLPFYWSHNNPVDMVATRNPGVYQKVMELMANSNCFDVILTMTSISFIERMKILKPINDYGRKMRERMSMMRQDRSIDLVVENEINQVLAHPDKRIIYISLGSSLGNPVYEKYDENKVMVFGGNPENAPIVLQKLQEDQKFITLS